MANFDGYRNVDVLTITDICTTIDWWTTESKSANISTVVGYSRTRKVQLFTCAVKNEFDIINMYLDFYKV